MKFRTRSVGSTETLNALLLMALGMGAGCSGQSSNGGGGAGEGGSSGVAGTAGAAAGLGGAGTGSGGSTAGIGGDGYAGVPPVITVTCTDPMPHLSESTGWISCSGGIFYHRPETGACEPHPPREEITYPNGVACTSDADCAGMPNGRCWAPAVAGNLIPPQCISECQTDADCGSGAACFCTANVNHCIPARCSTDADCAPDDLCATHGAPCGPNVAGLDCKAERAACEDPSYCRNPACVESYGNPICPMVGAGGCGRPFLVEGGERLAASAARSDWQAADFVPEELNRLSSSERAALAAYWTRVGLMEHASIAAFARFTLELLALGAPADLVQASTLAMADERRHTELGFALASAYAGSPVGPGTLELAGCLDRVDLATVIETTFLEGCIGETIAALEARELTAGVRDTVLRSALSEIAEDESDHAALAWRFLRWALEQNPELAGRTRALLERELRAARARSSGTPELAMASLELGLPSDGWRAALRVHVLEEVVTPCLSALLDKAATARSRTRPSLSSSL